jgi:hypothetical protein
MLFPPFLMKPEPGAATLLEIVLNPQGPASSGFAKCPRPETDRRFLRRGPRVKRLFGHSDPRWGSIRFSVAAIPRVDQLAHECLNGCFVAVYHITPSGPLFGTLYIRQLLHLSTDPAPQGLFQQYGKRRDEVKNLDHESANLRILSL